MPTVHEHLINVAEENTLTDVMWKCTSCWRKIGFNREGIGEPFASETAYPDDVDTYIGTECIPALIYIPKTTFYGQFSSIELINIVDSQDSEVRALVFRFNQLSDNGMPINHPIVMGGLAYIESIGLLGAGRANEILSACMP